MTTAEKDISEDLHHQMLLLGQAARSSADVLTRVDTSSKNAALLSAADSMRSSLATILEANAEDMEGARQRQVSSALSQAGGDAAMKLCIAEAVGREGRLE